MKLVELGFSKGGKLCRKWFPGLKLSWMVQVDRLTQLSLVGGESVVDSEGVNSESNKKDVRRRPEWGHGGEHGYLMLREAIISGKHLPNERLVEAELVTTLGVGRSVVRTALARLEQEGLVIREPNRGARVRLVNENEAYEIIEVRMALEGLAARKAAESITSQQCETLRSILGEMRVRYSEEDLLAYSDCNAKLHRFIIECSGHKTVRDLVDMLKAQSVRFQFRTILTQGRPEQSLAEHEAIVDAVCSGNGMKAQEAVENHLSHVAEALRACRNDFSAIDFSQLTR